MSLECKVIIMKYTFIKHRQMKQKRFEIENELTILT